MPNEIDKVIFAKIPDPTIDNELFEVVTKNMIHGQCRAININSPCVIDGKCSKRYPRELLKDTITDNDGNPIYRQRNTEDNVKAITLKVSGNIIGVDNRWVVSNLPLL